MLDAIKAANEFLDRIPSELHDQYMTEFMKMEEINKTTDDGIVVKCTFIVAFAKKSS
jgi:hypothetical protein